MEKLGSATQQIKNKMKKVLILGIKGMAGHVVYKYFQNIENFSTYGLARNIESSDQTFNVDVFETEKLSALILDNKFDFVVNCIGILNQDAENNPSKAIWFNSYFPHFLAQLTKDLDTQVIHISTDCVFNGFKGNYSESDIKDGIGFYAQSKSLGEIDNSKDLTIRTSIIGPELNENGIGLFNWFMKQNGEINGYTSAYWSGVTTLELAKALHYAMENPISGLVHLTNAVPINKFDLSIYLKIFGIRMKSQLFLSKVRRLINRYKNRIGFCTRQEVINRCLWNNTLG